MAKKVTKKLPLFGNQRSNALNKTKKKQSVNNQKVTKDGVTLVMSVREAKKIRKGNK